MTMTEIRLLRNGLLIVLTGNELAGHLNQSLFENETQSAFTDSVLSCLVTESSLSSFEMADDSKDDNKLSTQTSDELDLWETSELLTQV